MLVLAPSVHPVTPKSLLSTGHNSWRVYMTCIDEGSKFQAGEVVVSPYLPGHPLTFFFLLTHGVDSPVFPVG